MHHINGAVFKDNPKIRSNMVGLWLDYQLVSHRNPCGTATFDLVPQSPTLTTAQIANFTQLIVYVQAAC